MMPSSGHEYRTRPFCITSKAIPVECFRRRHSRVDITTLDYGRSIRPRLRDQKSSQLLVGLSPQGWASRDAAETELETSHDAASIEEIAFGFWERVRPV